MGTNQTNKRQRTVRVAPARAVAVAILGEQRRREAHARDLLRSSNRMKQLSARDRAFATRLALGVVGTSGALDQALGAHLKRSGSLEPKVRDCLRLSAYELLYLGTDPAIAVSQGVELVRRARSHAAGLANAVLHRVAEEDVPALRAAEDRLRAVAEADAKPGVRASTGPQGEGSTESAAKTPAERCISVDDLALVAGVPAWIAQGALDAYGAGSAATWALQLREPVSVCVANNLRAQSDETCLNVLKSRDFQPEQTGLVGSWWLGKAAHLAKSGLVSEVRVLPADLSTQLVARVATPKAGQSMLEVGQGRGTKSILALNNALRLGWATRSLVGVDSEEFKCNIASERLRKAGWGAGSATQDADEKNSDKGNLNTEDSKVAAPSAQGRFQSVCADARLLANPEQMPESLRQHFDLVLVDAPCSGVGTLRRHPEIAWSTKPEAVQGEGEDSLPALQLDLLRAAATRVEPGGTLVYTTCSFMKAEDEDVVERFLASPEGKDFRVAPVAEAPAVVALHEADPSGEGYELLAANATERGFVRIAPQAGFDQHFCARFVRRA